MKTINIYTDGACSGNQNENNIGGWGCILEYGAATRELHGGRVNTTNNVMELTALISALEALKEKQLNIRVFADSSYLINCFKQKWYVGWLKNGWKNSQKKPVENRELWERLLELMEGQTFEFYLIKGHLNLSAEKKKLKEEFDRFRKNNGSSWSYDDFIKIAGMNIRADELANIYIDEFRNGETGSSYALKEGAEGGERANASGGGNGKYGEGIEQKNAFENDGGRKPALVFDLDGTLWDSSIQVAESWNLALEKEYPEIRMRFDKAAMEKCMGHTMTEIAAMCFPEKDEEERGKILSVLSDYEISYLMGHPGDLFEGEAETLRGLKAGYDLYIASNCQRGYIEAFFVGTELGDLFCGRICFGDTGLSKDENLKKLIDDEKLGRAVMIGDTEKDRQAAVYAGIPFVHAAYGFGKVSGADASAQGFENLPQAIADAIKNI